ncbi:bacillithiol biosynthesis deacetylase BshB2 [Geomicrobium sp. JCM 19038]|uniref:bacillithiol biosynthesis deacetylase BshB2 n=1 Tax=Geomicrobium sp. JCM 19038 TaxID=1460635 RepID=UPI00045F1E7C|nr:bacillithiol biosynthesis deacetylase BshB2 [Geomicrobium sp. JCM 19038]GAK08670.1 LmbE family protein [Geomicrobium sp. JCM 19038]
MYDERHVLVIFPHPDDEAYGVSGTISGQIAKGTPVTYACLTLGEMGRNVGNPPIATRESLRDIRKRELFEAAESMGLDDLRMLGYRDKTLEFLDDGVLKQVVLNLIDELNPSVVISFYPEHGVHPDHDATSAAVRDALAEIKSDKRPRFWGIAITKDDPEIEYSVKPFINQKISTIKAHDSQFGTMFREYEKRYLAGEQEVSERLENERFHVYSFDDE